MQIELGNTTIVATLARSARRSIGFSVSPDGLAIRAPHFVSDAEIKQAIHAKAGWIERALARLQKQHQSLDDWRIGGQILLRGEHFAIHRQTRPNVVGLYAADRLCWVPSSLAENPVLLRTWLTRLLKAEARRSLPPLVSEFAMQLSHGHKLQKVSLSAARTLWGSCTARGDIRLHWRLVQVPLPLARYVAAHEVAHLAELNHSENFWAIVAMLYPDWQAARRELKNYGALLGGAVRPNDIAAPKT